MDDETKEILIDVINYYNTMGTESDPGIHTFEHIAQRASKVLENHAKEIRENNDINSSDVDPFSTTDEFPMYKLEDEW